MESKSTILIVDDEPFGRKTLEALLAGPAYLLAFACNGSEALAQATALTPDLVLLDVMMPDMDGFEVCRRLRADAHLAEVPVIMVTALDDRASRLRGIEAGADDIISKPFDSVELRTRVRTVTRLNRYRRLLREREKFERVTELAPDGIAILDAKGHICLSNPAFLRMVGIAQSADSIGVHIGQFIASEQALSCVDCLGQVLHNPADIVRLESLFVRLDGEHFPVEVTAGYVIWDEEPATQIIVRDITQRKQAEQALRESERHLRRSRDVLRLLFDGLDDSLSLLDSEGRVLAINQAMAELLGVAADEREHQTGQQWEALCNCRQPPFPGDSALKALGDGRARRHRHHLTNPDGASRMLDVQILPLIGPESLVDQVIVHVLDVTEQLQMESLAIQNEHFAARGRLAATVAHEVNTPLQSIQNCLYLAGKARDGQRETYLNLACEELERISTIVQQLLDLRHPRDDASPSPLNLNTLVEKVLLLTGGTLASYGIDVQRDLMPNPPTVSVYADHITQVILNLILNAVDAMPDGGRLDVRTLVGEVLNAGQPTSAFVIEIGDSGYGISPEIQARMFDPFFTTKSHGSGVGLAISQKIVAQHGGQIQVQSLPGHGSVFRVILPLPAQEGQPAG